MKTSESISTLAMALAKAQLAIEPATKNATNPHFRSHYANLESVWDACRGALNTNGLSVVQFPCDDVREGRIGLTTLLLHSSGEFLQETVSTRIVKDDPQGIGSALTYLRRYALASVVGVTATEDDDGNASSTPPTKSQATSSPAQHIPQSPPVMNAPPKSVMPTSLPTVDGGTEFFVGKISAYEVESGTSKTGKPFRRHRVSMMLDDGTAWRGATFSDTVGEQVQECFDENFPVRVDATKGKYGYTVMSCVATGLVTPTKGAMPNDLQF